MQPTGEPGERRTAHRHPTPAEPLEQGLVQALVAFRWLALAWMIAGKVLGGNPLGLHGFIPGVLVSLAVFVLVSLFTKPPEAALIRRAWGEE